MSKGKYSDREVQLLIANAEVVVSDREGKAGFGFTKYKNCNLMQNIKVTC